MSDGQRAKTIQRSIDLYDVIQRFFEEHERPPSLRDLVKASGLPSTSMVQQYMNVLKAWGWVDWQPRGAGTLRMTRPTENIFLVEREPDA
jgi:SOS-response transcriptional repressor LexA